jgi:hypothetical protein
LKFLQISGDIKENKNQKPAHSSGLALAHGFSLLAQPSHGSGPCIDAMRRGVARGHHAVVWLAWLAGGLPDDEVFTSSTGAL